MRICLDDLEFIISFTEKKDLKTDIFFKGEGKTLAVEFNNSLEKARMGFTKSFLPVGTYNEEVLALVVSVQYFSNSAKMVSYTFATMGPAVGATDD